MANENKCKRSWLEVILPEKTLNLTDTDGLYIQRITKTHPEGNTDSIEMKGVDGVRPTSSTYKPFDLEIEMLFRGSDKRDVDLFLFKLDNMLSLREPYYVRHSDLPGIKYAVLPTPKIEDSYKTIRDREITLTFTCYKGYSESYQATNKMNLVDGAWQFEEGIEADEDLKYIHYDWGFPIYNGSSDTINPFDHALTIKINIDAPNGFTLRNNTTGDVFEYYEPLKKSTGFMIKDIYPIKNISDNVGRFTNFEWLTLAPGFNDIEITGKDIGYTKSEWIFNYVFR